MLVHQSVKSCRRRLNFETFESRRMLALSAELIEIAPQSANANPESLVAMGDLVFFTADDGVHGTELWRSDGSEEGTLLLKDIASGEMSSNPEWLTVVGDTLYFVTSTADRFSEELWKSDGTEAGTTSLGNLSIATTNVSSIGDLLIIEEFLELDVLLFALRGDEVEPVYFTPSHDYPVEFQRDAYALSFNKLYRSDGTTEGTGLVATFDNSVAWTAMRRSTDELLFFRSNESSTSPMQLWASDGSEQQPHLIREFTSISSDSIALGDLLYFNADDGIHGDELWQSDGTPAGTVMVQDVNLSAESSNRLTVVDDWLYFTTRGETGGQSLWRTDGVQSHIVTEIQSGLLADFTSVGDRLFFTVGANNQRELWVSDGTPSGTERVEDMPSQLRSLTDVAGSLYFTSSSESAKDLYRLVETVDENECMMGEGDLDGDGTVGFSDFLKLSANFGAVASGDIAGDLDCDGSVGFSDFLILSMNFGAEASQAARMMATDHLFASGLRR